MHLTLCGLNTAETMLSFTYLQDFDQDLDVDPRDPQGETKHSGQHDEEHHHKHPHLENTYSRTPEVVHRSRGHVITATQAEPESM